MNVSLIDVAIPEDRNVIKKEAEKILIYRNAARVECEGKSDTSVNGATGTISKSLRQYLSNISGNHEIKELQKHLCWALRT
jgi:hypothetical protein